MSDAALTFKDYDNHIVRACNFYIWDLRHIHRCISCNVANTMAAFIVGIRLDYCNMLLHCATEKSLNKLHRVQNKLARVVCNVITYRQHAIEDINLLRNLHWLPAYLLATLD